MSWETMLNGYGRRSGRPATLLPGPGSDDGLQEPSTRSADSAKPPNLPTKCLGYGARRRRTASERMERPIPKIDEVGPARRIRFEGIAFWSPAGTSVADISQAGRTCLRA